VYEFSDPGFGNGASIPQATVLHNWGDIYSGQKWVGNGGGSNALSNATKTYGIYFDQSSNRLYWNYGYWYNATNPGNPSFGYSVLNDTTGQATGMGAWSLANRPEKFDRGGTMPIPQWFADRYTGGKTLGVGFGGYFNVTATASFGPALAAVSPPDLSTNPNQSALDNVPLVGYPSGAPDRAHRDPNYTSYYDKGQYATNTPGNWNPSGGTGYWTWSDIIYGGATWVDMPGVQGVAFLAKVGQGDVYYQHSDRHSTSAAYEWFVYDPKDLAAVAAGVKQQWQIQPKYEWVDPNLPMPIDQKKAPDILGNGSNQIGGMTFDPSTGRLYVEVNGAHQVGVAWYPQVFVYQVSAPTGT
jgi:hypothetical protein